MVVFIPVNMQQKPGPRDKDTSPQPHPDPNLITIGKVIKAFGLKGQVMVESLTEFPDRFAPNSAVLIRGRRYTISKSRSNRGRWTLKLEGIDHLDEARKLRGELLQIEASDLRPLPQGEYYRFQILGLEVVTPSGESLGQVTDILQTGANDVYVVTGTGKERLVPALPDVIREVDLGAGKMVVELPEGLP